MILERLPNGDLVYWCPACCRQHSVASSRWAWPGSFGDFAIASGVAVSLTNETRLCRDIMSQGWLRYLDDCANPAHSTTGKENNTDASAKPGILERRRLPFSIGLRYRGNTK